jgi:hypothetical protein
MREPQYTLHHDDLNKQWVITYPIRHKRKDNFYTYESAVKACEQRNADLQGCDTQGRDTQGRNTRGRNTRGKQG